ncbi:MAG: hypothetical protein WA642_15285 [Steroidobacteraceae bacterium]
MLSDPQDSDPSRWLTSLTWPLPAVVVHIGILAFDTRVWHTMVASSGRWGPPTMMSLGMRHLVMLAVLGGLYWASSAFDWLSNWSTGSFSGLRDPTPEELGCAAALLRLMLLFALYASAWRLAAAAFAHST